MITFSKKGTKARLRISNDSLAHLRDSSLPITRELQTLHALETVLECSCNKMRPQMHLRKLKSKIIPVNNVMSGMHAVSCEWFSKVKGFDIWQKNAHETPERLIDLVLSSKGFNRIPNTSSNVVPLFKRWPDVIEVIESELPCIRGMITIGNHVEKNKLSITMTSKLEYLPRRSSIKSKNQHSKNGPWLVFNHANLDRPTVVPVLSVKCPLPLAHEDDRSGIQSFLEKQHTGETVLSSGLFPITIQGKAIHASHYIHGKKLKAVLLAKEGNLGQVEKIKSSMERWGLKNLEVVVHKERKGGN